MCQAQGLATAFSQRIDTVIGQIDFVDGLIAGAGGLTALIKAVMEDAFKTGLWAGAVRFAELLPIAATVWLQIQAVKGFLVAVKQQVDQDAGEDETRASIEGHRSIVSWDATVFGVAELVGGLAGFVTLGQPAVVAFSKGASASLAVTVIATAGLAAGFASGVDGRAGDMFTQQEHILGV